jgi:hypothetical protein
MKGITLVDAIALSLTSFHVQRLQAIDDFDYSRVVAKTRKELEEKGKVVDDDFLRGGIWALKQYYAVALLDPKNMHAVSAVVDPFWHSHIIDTRAYVRFCQDVFGQYVHHAPLDEADPRQMQEIDALYRYTHGIYQEMFVAVDPEWWPHPDSRPLICAHARILDPEVQQHALFAVDPVTEQCVAFA